jgi:hypothetical protein
MPGMVFENGKGPGKCIHGGVAGVVPCAEDYVLVGDKKCMHAL